MKRVFLLLLLVLAMPAWGQTVTLPAEVKAEPGTFAVVVAQTDCATLQWVNLDPGLSLIPPALLKDSRSAVVMAGRAGRYRLLAYGAKDNAASPPAVVVVVVGEAPPTPPVPPDPTPPSPAPIPVAGFRVLIVYETAELSKLPPEQLVALNSQEVRQYLQAHCVLGPDGKTREWRLWDKDVNTSGESPLWQAAMQRPRQSVPWIILSDGKTGFEGPLPSDTAALLALLKKYGG